MENDSKTTSADNWGQIIRKDARGCFVEIKNDCFHLEKVHLQFVSYDTSLPKGSRYTSNINIYIDVPEFLALTQEAASGTLHMRMQQYKQSAMGLSRDKITVRVYKGYIGKGHKEPDPLWAG